MLCVCLVTCPVSTPCLHPLGAGERLRQSPATPFAYKAGEMMDVGRRLETALTSVAATLGTALSGWGERALVPRAGERRAGVRGAGGAPSGADAHGAGRGTPLAVVLRSSETEGQTVTPGHATSRGEKKGEEDCRMSYLLSVDQGV